MVTGKSLVKPIRGMKTVSSRAMRGLLLASGYRSMRSGLFGQKMMVIWMDRIQRQLSGFNTDPVVHSVTIDQTNSVYNDTILNCTRLGR